MSDRLYQTTRPTSFCPYPSFWTLQDIKEIRAIDREDFGLNGDFHGLNNDFLEIPVSDLVEKY